MNSNKSVGIVVCLAACLVSLSLPAEGEELGINFVALTPYFSAEGFRSAEDRARELVAKMTLEEKISQTCNRSPAIPRLGIPACDWWNEALHGVARSGIATVFPQTIGRAATFDSRLEHEVGAVIGTEARAKANAFARRGIRCRYACPMLLSPTVNLFRDPRWGRGQETFGEDPFLAGRMGVAFVRGIQGDDPEHLRATACAKHFAVHSGPEQTRRTFDARVSMRDMMEYYLEPFRALVVDGRVASVMSSYNAINGVPATMNRWLLTDLLRGEWGFRGYTITDSDGIWHLANTRGIASELECAALAAEAGLDIEIGTCWTNLLAAVRGGRIAESVIDDKVVRAMTMRIRLGLGGGSSPYDSLGAGDVDTLANRALALRCAEKSLVLVKNDRGVLPLDRRKLRRICVTGLRALDEVALYGNYYGIASHAVPVLSGVAKSAGVEVQVNDIECSDDADHPLDAVVVCIGLTAEMEGEQGSPNAKSDRAGTALPESDIALLRNIRKTVGALPVVAVVFGGSPLDLGLVAKQCDAILFAWYPGEEGGTAVANALFGDVNPGGRLPVTFPGSDVDLPPMSDYSLEGRTYLYARSRPQYPFGYGLSYTRFAYSNLRTERTDSGVKVTVSVKNAGTRDGDEVVQLYVRAPAAAGDRRLHHLEGFSRVSFAAGESRDVSFVLDRSQFSVFGEDGRRITPDGEFTIFVGGCQPGFADVVQASVVFSHS